MAAREAAAGQLDRRTVGGLAAAGVAFWAVGHVRLVEQGQVALGL